MKHTPGPWTLDIEEDTCSAPLSCDKQYLDEEDSFVDHEEIPYTILRVMASDKMIVTDEVYPVSEADLRLIAAAPELFEACWTALTALEMNHHLVTDQLERSTSICAQSILKKAIAKAEGEL